MTDHFLEGLDFENFYTPFLSSGKRIGDELLTNCPFHDDNTASFSVNLENGLWKCHAAHCPRHSGGNAVQFYSYVKNIPVEEAIKVITKAHRHEIAINAVDNTVAHEVEQQHKNLFKSPNALAYLHDKCAWNDEIIKKYEIGFDGKRYWIPIREEEELVNVRKYCPTDVNKMTGMAGNNKARLWPMDNLKHSPKVYIFEGEKDCILANQLGLNAITVTAGAGTFKAEWVFLFKDKDVVICYDIDEAGKKGANAVAEFICGVSKSVKVLELPIAEPPNGDFTDYILKHKKTIEDFQAAELNTKEFESSRVDKVAVEDKIYEAELSQASSKDYFFKRTLIKGVVVGKDLAPYLVPKTIHVKCSMGKKMCAFCGVGEKGGDFQITFTEESPDVLRLINCSDMQQERVIREKLNVNGTCRQYTYEIKEAQNVEEIKIIPEIKYSTDTREYVIRTGYYLGHGCKTNQSYEITSITMPHPQTQYSTHLVYGLQEAGLSIENFHLTEELIQKLKAFAV
jgi:hypothetical protein